MLKIKGKKEIMYRPLSIFLLYNYVLCAYAIRGCIVSSVYVFECVCMLLCKSTQCAHVCMRCVYLTRMQCKSTFNIIHFCTTTFAPNIRIIKWTQLSHFIEKLNVEENKQTHCIGKRGQWKSDERIEHLIMLCVS